MGTETVRKRGNRFKHGYSGTRTYKIWAGMKARCTNKNEPRYEDYGGRGIRVCRRWLKFENFLADMGDAPAGLTLERKDNEKGYCKSNCCWSTYAEQMKNTRRSVLITAFGLTKNLEDWASATGLSRRCIRYRLASGLTPEVVLSTPVVTLTDFERKQRFAARQRLRRAVVTGRVVRSKSCDLCGRASATQAHHHSGYIGEAALCVWWLCSSCHRSRLGPCHG